jgi:hypothetical protein
MYTIIARGGDFLSKNFRDLFTKERFQQELAEEITKDFKKNRPNSADTGNRH